VIEALVAALFGSLLGSFLNVCIVRLPQNQSVVSPRSRCPRCGYQLGWYDNIPVLSWLILRARCRKCSLPISAIYPVVELLTAAIWGASVYYYGPTLIGLQGAVFGTLLLGILMTDAREYIIPDEFTWGGLVIGLGFAIAGGVPAIIAAVIGAVAGFGLLYAVAWAGEKAFKKEAMGGGDIKMMAMVGSFVGWAGVLMTVFGGALIGALIFGPISLKKKILVPFGVFLAIAAAVVFVAGDDLSRWYLDYALGR
jgi:leader peptidase (prepilin peptidase)/N-methyltransferase